MPKAVIITQRTRDAFYPHVRVGYELRDTTRPLADGTFELELDDDVFERLQEHRLPGESDDDVLFRALTTAGKGAN